MGLRKFYIKHQDIIELAKAYFGVILIVVLAICFDWVPIDLDGMFNSQVEIIIEACMKPNLGLCP